MGSFASALYDALRSAGVAEDRARAVADLFDRSLDERWSQHAQDLATKADLAALATKVDLGALATKGDLVGLATKSELGALATKAELAGLATKGDLAELRAKVAEDVAETNMRVSRLETRIAETKSDLLKWMLAALTAQTALLLSLKLV